MSLQSIADLIVHTKTVTSQEPVFTVSLEQRTENPRVVNSVIAPVNMHPEGFDLIGGFFMTEGFGGRYYSCLSSGGACRFHFVGMMFQRSNEMFRYEKPNLVKGTFTSNPYISNSRFPVSQKLERVVQCLFKPP